MVAAAPVAGLSAQMKILAYIAAAALGLVLAYIIAGVVSYSAALRKQRSFTFDAATGMIAQNGVPRAAWVPVHTSPRGDTVSIDTGTYFFQPGGKTFTIWTRFVFGDTGKLAKDSAGRGNASAYRHGCDGPRALTWRRQHDD